MVLYGAGPGKIAKILECSPAQGKKAMNKFLKAFPALKQLKDDLVKAMKSRKGFLKGLDGRLLHVRTEYSALNVVCQSAGALVMKKALVILDKSLQEELRLVPGVDYEFLLNIHDEFQLEVADREGLPERVGAFAVQSIRDAGAYFKIRCPLDGEYKVGLNWKDTH